MAIRLVLVDDHNALRQSMKTALLEERGFDVVGSFSSVEDAKLAIPKIKPDLVMADIILGGATGLELASWIKKKCPGIRIVIFTMHDNEDYVREALKINVDGYVLKDSFLTDVVGALRSAYNNKRYLSPSIAKVIVDQPRNWYGKKKTAFGKEMLTDKEREVLKMIADGHRLKEIARALQISIRTAETHRKNIMSKLDIHSSIQLARYAIKAGLLD